MRALLLTSLVLVGCGGDEAVPTAAELYGAWTGTADAVSRRFVFAAADDGTHPELAGMADVYTQARDGVVGQAGHYRIEVTAVNGHGTTDALVTVAVSGAGAPGTYGNAILDYTGDTLTISSEAATAGQLTLARE
jgi:hypothetical protein